MLVFNKNEKNRYCFTRKELNNKSAMQFKDGDIIECGKYFVWIKYGNYTRPSLLTTVSTCYDLRDMKLCKQPQFIRDFIERDLEEIV